MKNAGLIYDEMMQIIKGLKGCHIEGYLMALFYEPNIVLIVPYLEVVSVSRAETGVV